MMETRIIRLTQFHFFLFKVLYNSIKMPADCNKKKRMNLYQIAGLYTLRGFQLIIWIKYPTKIHVIFNRHGCNLLNKLL